METMFAVYSGISPPHNDTSQIQRTLFFVSVDSPYIHSYFNLSAMDTSPQRQQSLKRVPNYQKNLSTMPVNPRLTNGIYQTQCYTSNRLPKPRTEAMRRTFFYSTIKNLKALNLNPTASFYSMKATLIKSTAPVYTVDNFTVKKLF